MTLPRSSLRLESHVVVVPHTTTCRPLNSARPSPPKALSSVTFWRDPTPFRDSRILRLACRVGPYLRTQIILDRVLPTKPCRILDVGGGAGVYATWLAGRGHTVHLVDPVPEHVEQAAMRSGPPGLEVESVLPVEGMLAWAPNLPELLADPDRRALVLHCLERMEADPAVTAATPHLLTIARPVG